MKISGGRRVIIQLYCRFYKTSPNSKLSIQNKTAISSSLKSGIQDIRPIFMAGLGEKIIFQTKTTMKLVIIIVAIITWPKKCDF